jgi:demethylmenaquinone methyltransferase/2-methoxy-6-polyprenyl-1,4-benzoquinol methylase/phosphoethanolamine N-methyltransferase
MHHELKHEQLAETRGRTMPLAARFYDAIMALLTVGRERRFRNVALGLAQLQQGEAVLDVGCGTGTLALLAKERVGPSGQVHGIDATPQMVERAKAKAHKKKVDVHFDEGLVERLDFPDERFDVVFSTLMMHHLPMDLKQQGLKEIRRVLKAGGRLLIVDFGGRGHSLGTLIHGQQAKRLGDGLAHLVASAGFSGVETGRAGMGGMISVKGVKMEQSFPESAAAGQRRHLHL